MTETVFLAALLGLSAAAIALLLVALLATATEDRITNHREREDRPPNEIDTDQRQGSPSVDQQNPAGRKGDRRR
jgi:hypothetical protein